MVCPNFEDLILGRVDGSLDQDERRAADAHVEACSGCRAFLEVQQRLDAALSTALAPPAMRAGVERRLLRQLEFEARSARFERLASVLNLAGAVPVAVCAGYLLAYLPPLDSPAGLWAAAMASLFLVMRALRPGNT